MPSQYAVQLPTRQQDFGWMSAANLNDISGRSILSP
jgi:hypothetical protein